MKTPILSLVAFAIYATSAHAQVFDVQIGTNAGETYTGTGADTSSGSHTFDQITSPVADQSITATDGSTTAFFSLSTPSGEYQNGFYDGGGNSTSLYDSYNFKNDASTTPITFGISGLSAEDGDTFTAYLYAQGSNHNTTRSLSTSTQAAGYYDSVFTLTDGGSGNASATGDDNGSGGFTNGVEYAVLTGTITDGTVSFSENYGPATGEADLSGLQLDIRAPSSTPEPSVWAMLLTGLGALAFVTRRRVMGDKL